MKIVAFDIKTASERIRDDATELFFRWFMDRDKIPFQACGVVGWRLKHKDFIEPGEEYIEMLFEYEGEYYPNNYGLLALRYCYTFNIKPDFFKSDEIDLDPLIEISNIYPLNVKRYEGHHLQNKV